MILKPGTKLIMLYVVTAYVIPWGLICTAGYPWIYREPELNIGALAVLMFTYLSSILIGNINMVNNKNRIRTKIKNCL